MLSALVTLAFAVLAFAAPLSSSSSAPCISAEFSLAMNYNGAWLSIDAIPNGTPNSLNLVGQRVDFYPGDPGTSKGFKMLCVAANTLHFYQYCRTAHPATPT